MVFVLDKHKRPLMPCTPKRARLLLAQGRAAVHRIVPFVIRLKDRRVEDSALQPLVLKIDPGSKTSGLAVARVEATREGEMHHAVFLAEIGHRGEEVHTAMGTRARARRRRRSANLRYRPARFNHRTRPQGWLPPYKAQGAHKGRVAVRKSRFFSINGVDSDSIPARYCRLLQRGDGYEYALA